MSLGCLRGIGEVHGRSTWLRASLCVLVMATAGIAGTDQDFESWTPMYDWGTRDNGDGWAISDGWVRNAFRWDPPRSGDYAAWLHSYSSSTNSWLTGYSALGAQSAVFHYAASAWAPGSNEFKVQYSRNATNWTTAGIYSTASTDWMVATNTIGVSDPVWIRFLKTGDSGGDVSVGFDDIIITEAPGVIFGNLRHSPGTPTVDDEIHVLVDALDKHPSASNIAVRAWYRFDETGPFVSRPMVVTTGDVYRTETPIPKGRAGILEYYIHATYAGLADSQTEFPVGGRDNPATATIIDPGSDALDPRQFGPSSRRTPLTITEIMYHPPDRPDGRDIEFVEVFNTDPVTHDISGCRISGGVEYTFPSNTFLKGRSHLVVAREPQAIVDLYPVSHVHGPYDGSLGNGGDRVRLRNPVGAVILEVEYDDNWPWPTQADGAGHSLVLAGADYGEGDRRAWSAGAHFGGSPGLGDAWGSDPLSRIVINEMLAHTDVISDFVEFYNPGTQSVDLAGCVLSETLGGNSLVITQSTVVAPGQFAAFDTNDLGFALSMAGGDLYLVDTNRNRVIDAVRYPAQVNGVSSGRYPDGSPEFRVLATPTAGSHNSNLFQQDVVINEIMYHPLWDDSDDEYIELYNRTTQPVDLGHWRFTDGVSFTFPAGTSIGPTHYLVVAKNAARMVAKYPQLTAGNTIGNYGGSLSDRGERVVLSRPDDPSLPDQDFVVVDTVEYSDGDSWGRWADGGGSSLELIDPHGDNRRPSNWRGSDESGKSEWIEIDYEDYVSDGSDVNSSYGTDFDVLFVLANQAGEFLIDDIEMARASGGANLVPNPGLGTQMSPWQARGNQMETARDPSGGYGDNGGVLHVRAAGQANIRSMATARRRQYDRVEIQLSSPPVQNQRYRMRAKVRWLAGWPFMRLSQGWFWMEALCEMPVPTDLGTPGQPNSHPATNAPPVVTDLQHSPLLPAALDDVVVACRVTDPDGVDTPVLEYRNTSASVYTATNMNDDGVAPDTTAGDGVYAAGIPGQSSGAMIGFRLRIADTAASPASAYYPSGDLMQDCLVRFGDPTPNAVLAHHTIWVSPENEALWESWDTKGNGMVDMTWVYNGVRVAYNSRIRWRGNGRNYSDIKSASYSFSVPKVERFIGSQEVKVDIPSRGVDKGTHLQETCAYWTCRQVGAAASQVRLIHVHVNGSTLLRHDLEPASRELCSYWYDDGDPHCFEHKAEDPLEKHVKTATGAWNMAIYRHGIQKKRTGFPDVDYRRLMLIADALQLPAGATATARLLALIDPYGMGAYFAGNRVSRGRDTYGWTNMHNGFAYGSPHKRMRWHLVDMDAAFSSAFQTSDGLFPTTDSTNDAYSNRPGQIYEIPVFRRAYLRILKNIADGPFDPNRCTPFMEQWRQALIDEGVTTSSVSTILSYIATRRGHILSELATHATELAIATPSGGQTAERVIDLAGTAPFEVKTLVLNGDELNVTFPSVTDWETRIELRPGTNVLSLRGFDREGIPVIGNEIVVTSTAQAVSPAGKVVITEIMYNPIHDMGGFVEVHNRSAGESFDLGGWRLEGADFTFDAGTVIDPGEYRVVVADRQVYAHLHTNSEVVVGEYDGSLDNGGETLSLRMPVGSNAWETIDVVTYDDDPPWPTDADGFGPSLQLMDVSRDNNRIGNWAVATAPTLPGGPRAPYTPGEANSVATSLPEFPSLWINEVMPSNITAAADNMLEFEPWIEIYNGWTGVVDLADGYALSDDGTNVMKWLFPAGQTLAAGERLLVWADGEAGETVAGFLHAAFRLNSVSGQVVLARETLGHPVVLDSLSYDGLGADQSYGAYPEGDPGSRQVFHFPTPGNANSASSHVTMVRINEWMTDNDGFLADPADGQCEDWFELYNASPDPVNLGGYTLTDDLAATNRYTVPGGKVIGGGGYLLVWADGEPDQNGFGGDIHADFQLSKSGEAIGLYAPDGSLVDAVTFGAQLTDHSDGCWPDGAAAEYAMVPPTPGDANQVLLMGGLSAGGPLPPTLTWQAESGAVYRVDWRDSLVTSNWIPLTVVTARADIVELIDPGANPARFYRLRLAE